MPANEHEIRIATDTHVAMTNDAKDATILVASDQGGIAVRVTRQQLQTLALQIAAALSQAAPREPAR